MVRRVVEVWGDGTNVEQSCAGRCHMSCHRII
jgi:hypothetical protein